jgi:hypothetical protein
MREFCSATFLLVAMPPHGQRLHGIAAGERSHFTGQRDVSPMMRHTPAWFLRGGMALSTSTDSCMYKSLPSRPAMTECELSTIVPAPVATALVLPARLLSIAAGLNGLFFEGHVGVQVDPVVPWVAGDSWPSRAR